MPINTENFIVDPTPYRESSGINQLNANRQRQEEMEYRRKMQEESDQWKKLNLIQDLTDLSKHQTGSDVANAIGNQQANQVFQKYTQGAQNMSPAELQYNISKDMQGVMGGMDALKTDLTNADQQLQLLKTKFPNLNVGELAKVSRADVLGRRLKNEKEFVSPLEVAPSAVDLGDPDFLSQYVIGNKNLTQGIINPQGADDATVYRGSPTQYTKYSAKIPFWKKPNYDSQTLKGGFLPSNQEPSLEIKGSVLPSESLPSSNGKPFKIVDEDVYNRFSQDEASNLELIAATRQAYPNYNKFNPTEKNYAKRNVLYKQLETLDQSQFHPTEVHTPSASLLKFYAGGSQSNQQNIDLSGYPDEADGSKNITDLMQGIKVTGLPNGQSLLAEKVVYNPNKKEITFKEYTSRDENGKLKGGQTKTVSLTKFLQDIKSNNPNTDMKFLDGLWHPTGTSPAQKHPLPSGKPRTVQQGGHTYTWSEEKGAYQ